MKKIFSIVALVSFLASCGGGTQGRLVGVKGKKWQYREALRYDYSSLRE